MSRLSKDEAYDISDSTDWLQTPLRSLAPVDSALRCQVCRDFYDTPMITLCCHTFCSRCIRQCLNNDGKCPTCRKGADAIKLRNNFAIEELVEAFQRARPEVMEYTKRISQEATRSSSPKRKRMGVDEGSSPIRKRTRSGTRAQQSSQQSVIDLEADDADYIPGPGEQYSRRLYEEGRTAGQVLCPICQDAFPTIKAVQAHVDHCDGEPSKKHSNRSNQTPMPLQPASKPTKRPEPLAQLHYGVLKDNALRKKLQDSGILSTGPRQLMERRYTEWVTIWNANCDSRNPKQRGELKRLLDTWERTQGGGAFIASRANPGENIRSKDFDREAWSQKQNDPFKQLLKEARRKKPGGTEDPGDGSRPESATGPAIATSTAAYTSPYGPTPGANMAPPSSKQPSTTLNVTESGVPSSTDEKHNNHDPAPTSPGTRSSQRRFFEDSTTVPTFEKPSSQDLKTQILDKDVSMSSDMATLRSLKP